MNKNYINPSFDLIRQTEVSKVYFAASSEPQSTSTGQLGTMSQTTVTSW